ncbi:MAG: NTP transferase domain-containing protein [Suipraeoptans sp.]
MISAILLASGYSRRLNGNKLLLDFRGKPIIEHTMRSISSCNFDLKLLVTRDNTFSMLSGKYGFQELINTQAHVGQSAGVRLGTLNTQVDSSLMFFVGDQPLLGSDIINQLLHESRSNPDKIIVPKIDNRGRSPVIFPPSLRAEILNISGDMGGRSVISKYPTLVHSVYFSDPLPFSDIDTPGDYDVLRSLDQPL